LESLKKRVDGRVWYSGVRSLPVGLRGETSDPLLSVRRTKRTWETGRKSHFWKKGGKRTCEGRPDLQLLPERWGRYLQLKRGVQGQVKSSLLPLAGELFLLSTYPSGKDRPLRKGKSEKRFGMKRL